MDKKKNFSSFSRKKLISLIISIIILDFFNYNLIILFFNDDSKIKIFYLIIFFLKLKIFLFSFFLEKKLNLYFKYFFNLLLNIVIIFYMINNFKLSNEFIILNYMINYYCSLILEILFKFFLKDNHLASL
ncbi:hypothetical protein [Candidatus Karelsulcia muelleri]|uniref:hypothetical protein n=1 Tax=Candidatus Karelsulcia muelleri TaxID=336810 RepID=UPI000D7CF167|nr:hypothetical protein [Candidatus Karelsulcia muelleri]